MRTLKRLRNDDVMEDGLISRDQLELVPGRARVRYRVFANKRRTCEREQTMDEWDVEDLLEAPFKKGAERVSGLVVEPSLHVLHVLYSVL